MPDNRPESRKRNVTGSGSGAFKTGSGLGTGPVGSTGGHSGGGPAPGGHSSGGNRAAKRGGGVGLGTILLILVIYFLFFRGDSDSDYDYDDYDSGYSDTVSTDSGYATDPSMSELLGGSGSSLYSTLTTDTYGDSEIYTDSNYSISDDVVSSMSQASSSSVDTSVSAGARDKRTVIKGGGNDIVTIMVYLCGTDLESKSGMASNDLAEMAKASLSDKVNIIVYTGGCKKWKTSGISSKTNQIYQIKNGGIKRLVEDDGNKTMTDPATLTGFIKYCNTNFPANRNELILWDHGGGTVSGFGYDEKTWLSDAMDLAEIDKALKDGGVAFDFVGFDACLMATAETALMLDDYADYLIASEETEPGIGWYYTNWLNRLSKDTSTATVDIGKMIIDDFNAACAQMCPGQKTTLSIIDLAEFSDTVAPALSAFAKSVNTSINDGGYKAVSDAIHGTREFGVSVKIDQIDLVDLCDRMGTSESKALASAVKGAVKYNRTFSGYKNAYGVSIYFPQKQKGMVNQALTTYQQIGMDPDYITCIKSAADMQTSGVIASGGGYGLDSSLTGNNDDYSGGDTLDVINSFLDAFLSDRSMPGSSELNDIDTSYYDEKSFDDSTAEFISLNSFDPSSLVWTDGADGSKYFTLSEDQWSLVHDLDLNLFIDDGAGYIEMGLDNVFDIDGNDMYADMSGAWLMLNGQFMPYYHTDTVEINGDTIYMGYSPALLNGERVNLLVEFNSSTGKGAITGASTDYNTDTPCVAAKNTAPLNVGDKIQFICDYYTYNFEFQDAYKFGNEITVSEDMELSDGTFGNEKLVITYRLTDIYEREYWTPKITK